MTPHERLESAFLAIGAEASQQPGVGRRSARVRNQDMSQSVQQYAGSCRSHGAPPRWFRLRVSAILLLPHAGRLIQTFGYEARLAINRSTRHAKPRISRVARPES